MLSNRCGKPLHSLLVHGRIWQQVSRTAERQGSIALQLSPNADPLNRTLRWETEHQKKPRSSCSMCRYIHLTNVIPITFNVKRVEEEMARVLGCPKFPMRTCSAASSD